MQEGRITAVMRPSFAIGAGQPPQLSVAASAASICERGTSTLSF